MQTKYVEPSAGISAQLIDALSEEIVRAAYKTAEALTAVKVLAQNTLKYKTTL